MGNLESSVKLGLGIGAGLLVVQKLFGEHDSAESAQHHLDADRRRGGVRGVPAGEAGFPGVDLHQNAVRGGPSFVAGQITQMRQPGKARMGVTTEGPTGLPKPEIEKWPTQDVHAKVSWRNDSVDAQGNPLAWYFQLREELFDAAGRVWTFNCSGPTVGTDPTGCKHAELFKPGAHTTDLRVKMVSDSIDFPAIGSLLGVRVMLRAIPSRGDGDPDFALWGSTDPPTWLEMDSVEGDKVIRVTFPEEGTTITKIADATAGASIVSVTHDGSGFTWSIKFTNGVVISASQDVMDRLLSVGYQPQDLVGMTAEEFREILLRLATSGTDPGQEIHFTFRGRQKLVRPNPRVNPLGGNRSTSPGAAPTRHPQLAGGVLRVLDRPAAFQQTRP